MTVEQTDGRGMATVDPAEMEWRDLTRDALEIGGGDLERGDSLVGVPFCITGLKFWRGDYVRSDDRTKNGDVVAIYLTVGPEYEIARGIRRGRIEMPLSVEAGEVLVFNEAGTGMYRQLVAILEAQGFITLPEGRGEGVYGESRYDTPIDLWTNPDGSGLFTDSEKPTIDFTVKILCPRGLRLSEYENEHTKAGRTRYIG